MLFRSTVICESSTEFLGCSQDRLNVFKDRLNVSKDRLKVKRQTKSEPMEDIKNMFSPSREHHKTQSKIHKITVV